MSALITEVIDLAGAVVESEHLALPGLATKINTEVSAAELSAKSAVQHALAAGEMLIQAKSHVPHGQWETWLQRNCQVAPRTAQAYMRLHTQVAALPQPEAQRVAGLPLRQAINAISTSPTAPPRHPTFHQPRREQRDRAADALKKAADAQRALIRHIGVNYIKRAEVERTRAKLQAALAALDDLQFPGEANTVVEMAV